MLAALDLTPLIGAGTGVATFVRGAVGALAARDDVRLRGYGLTWRGRGGLVAVAPPGVEVRDRPMPAAPLQAMWARSAWPPAEWWTGRVDVVHGTNFVVPPTRRAATVVTVHDLTAARFPEWCAPASLRYPALVRRALARGAWVHTHSRAVAAEVVELLGAEPDRVVAVPPGLEPGPAGDPARGRLRAGAERYVLALGTVEPRKGLPDLVEAFGLLAPDRPDVALVVAGPDGWGASELAAAVDRSPAVDRIRRLGWVEPGDRADLLAGAAVVAVPSRYEGFGFPVLEAMAAGSPVVATRAGSLPEVAGAAGRLVEPGDPEALAEALAAVLDDAGRAGAMAEAGRAQAATFRWDACAAGLVELYGQALRAQR